METGNRLDDVAAGVIRPLNQAEAKLALSLLKEIGKTEPSVAELVKADGPLKAFFVAAFSLSPFLRDVASIRPKLLAGAIDGQVEDALAALVDAARDAWRPVDARIPSENEVMTALRSAKRAFGFLLALADLARIFSARDTTRWLSEFAQASTAAAIDHLLLAAHESGKLRLVDPAEPSRGSGLIVLGMGKLGGRELNYSSDIDIVVFYDPDAGILADPLDASETYGRMMRRLIRILQERTADGYVFRTDLRLRPDPGSTPLAVSMDAALIYYEGRGQNWERAAFIKARPVAGDIVAGEGFLKLLMENPVQDGSLLQGLELYLQRASEARFLNSLKLEKCGAWLGAEMPARLQIRLSELARSSQHPAYAAFKAGVTRSGGLERAYPKAKI